MFSESRRRVRNSAFSLVELLIVVAIIAVLLAILLPAIPMARESARRTLCASRIHQILAADLMYASDNSEMLIPGSRDANDQGEHCIWISHEAYDAYAKYSGSALLLTCPNLEESGLPFNPAPSAPQGWVMGYDFIGGHKFFEQLFGWVSPMRATESGSLPLVSDLNDWAPIDLWTAVAHAYKVPAAAFEYDGGKTPTQFPSAGGNIGYLDGSVEWKPLSQLTIHEDSGYPGIPLQYYAMF